MWIESFNLALDANNDGAISLEEAWHLFEWLYLLPGNLVIEVLGNLPPIAHLLHISASVDTGYRSLNGGMATIVSLLIWLLALIQLASVRERWKTKRAGAGHRKFTDYLRHPAGKI